MNEMSVPEVRRGVKQMTEPVEGVYLIQLPGEEMEDRLNEKGTDEHVVYMH